jgi:hypothetical protein
MTGSLCKTDAYQALIRAYPSSSAAAWDPDTRARNDLVVVASAWYRSRYGQPTAGLV